MEKRAGLRIVVLLLWACSAGIVTAHADIRPPTGERDVILLIGQYQPHLYRLVGQQPVPFGNAQFYSPQAIIADERQKCFYVFDEPRMANEMNKIWRVAADGTARVVFQAQSKSQGGPFSNVTSLAVDRNGQLLIADTVTGLWQLGANAQLRCLLDGKHRPLYKISAVADAPAGLLVATNFLDTVTGGDILSGDPDPQTGVGDTLGHQTPIRVWKNQGGLYLVPPNTPAGLAQTVLVNRKPGSAEYDTLWRVASQILVDASGRVVLVDEGSIRHRKEEVYTGSRYKTDHPQQRKTTSDIHGGLLVLHPNGQFEDLTFKTPDQKSGPMRHPRAVAQWSDDTYLVADPKMYVEGIPGAGGLFLLKLDGSRQARWPFGQRLRPMGVAILRDAGPAAQATPTAQIRLADLAGTRTAGRITRIASVSWQRKGTGGGLMGPQFEEQSGSQAQARLRAVFENARWSIGPDGTLLFAAGGVNPQTQGTPLVMRGTVTAHEGMLSVSASYKTQSLFDTQLGSIDARLYGAEPGTVRLDMTINVFTKTERLKGAFEQTMSLQGN